MAAPCLCLSPRSQFPPKPRWNVTTYPSNRTFGGLVPPQGDKPSFWNSGCHSLHWLCKYRKSCFLPVFTGSVFLLFLLFYNPLFLKVDIFFFRVENLTPTETNHSRVLNQHFTQYSSPVLGVSCSNLPQLLSFQSLVLPSLVSHWREVTMVSTLGVFLPCCVFWEGSRC